jgi:hypothetical protein
MFEWVFEVLCHSNPSGQATAQAADEKKARVQVKMYLRTGEKAGKLLSKKEIGE